MESRAERVPSNHCSLHCRPFSTITFSPVVNSATGPPINNSADQNLQNNNVNDTVHNDVAASIMPFSVARNVEIRTSGDNGNNDTTQREADTNLSNTATTAVIPSIPNTPLITAVCEQCVEQFKTHIQELCKRGLHKIPIITCRNP
ncbi:hypothetical protein Smp_175970 [Schistosoma mansoni]|nr:hypothetical protein Smp_175970 [Schistosoma mansoni]|eukprot:XP_018644027.1 hypothetical protein Smp_175970 [Schistosoma mansoni]